MQPQVLNVLTCSMTVGPLLVIFGRLCSLEEVPEDGKKENVISVFKKGKKGDLGKYKLVSLALTPGKVIKKFLYTQRTR